MRIIAGTARGKTLQALAGQEITRPTIDRIKEAMFSAVHFLVPGAVVLDLFAGSGQLGIEALSRGAKRCVFVDDNPQAVCTIKANCQTAGLQQQSQVHQGNALHFLQATQEKFHIVLLDPPYKQGTLAQILPLVAAVTQEGGTVLCESEVGADLPLQCEGLTQKKQHRYGTVLVTRYEKESRL